MLVQVDKRENSVWLTLNRPQRANALSSEMVEALHEAVDTTLRSPPKALVFRGAGKHFCSGFDLSSLEQETDASLAYRLLRIELLLQKIHCAPCYTIALAHGTVAGAGADLVVACNRRIGTQETRLRFPGIRFGIVLGTRRLIELIGPQACSIVLEQRTIEADQALKINLLDSICPEADWQGEAGAAIEAVARVDGGATALALGSRADSGLCHHDMGVLARSLIEPGLQQRISAFLSTLRAGAAKSG